MVLPGLILSRNLFSKVLFTLVTALMCTNILCQGVSVDTLFSLAKKSLSANNYTKAIKEFQACLTLAEKQGDVLKTANAYIGLGIANDESGNYQQALINYFRALKGYEQSGNIPKQAGTLKNIGNVYRALKTFDKSGEFLANALTKYNESHDSTGISGVINDMGILYMEQDSSDRAISCFNKVIYTYGLHAKEKVKAFALNNMAITYSKLGNYPQALKCYRLSLAAMRQLKDEYGIGLVLGNLGSVYNKLGDYSTAAKYGRQAMEISERIGSKELLGDIYDNLSTSYHNLRNHRDAYDLIRKELRLKDTIFSKEKARNYIEMETRYQNEKKQQEILLLKQQATIDNLAIEEQGRRQLLLLLVLVFVSLLGLLIYRNYRIKQNLNRKLNVVNTKLSEANSSKTKLLGIISHDLRTPVSNLFTFLQYQKRNPGAFTREKQDEHNNRISEAANNLLEAMEDLLVWSKSQMDSFKPCSEEIDVPRFLDEIIYLNSTAACNKNIELLKECPQKLTLRTDPNFLKIILRNLTSNAIKFTPPQGVIRLTATIQHGTLDIMVKDNGEGISADNLQALFEFNSIRSDSSGLGLKLAKEFTEKLNATIEVISAQNTGTCFKLSFPAEYASTMAAEVPQAIDQA